LDIVCDKSTFYGARNSLVNALLIETGLRATELIKLNIEDISFENSSILVKMGKGRKPRTVFIGTTVRRQLRKYLKFRNDVKGALFTSKGGERLKYSGLRQILRRLSVKAGLSKPPQIHSYRREYCLQSLQKGIDLVSISRLMGHSGLGLLTIYAKQTTNH
jgi:integrase/recombinase XerD